MARLKPFEAGFCMADARFFGLPTPSFYPTPLRMTDGVGARRGDFRVSIRLLLIRFSFPARRHTMNTLEGKVAANYGAAKSAIAGLTRVVARDLGRYGVTCNAIAPRAWTRLVATIPGRDGNPDTTGLQQFDPDMIAPLVG